MTAGDPPENRRPRAKAVARDDRQNRLARALRDNLARRKAQARSRDGDAATAPDPDAPDPTPADR